MINGNYIKRKDVDEKPLPTSFEKKNYIVNCPATINSRDVVTLISCIICEFHAAVEEGDGEADHYVKCCFPRDIPTIGVKGETN